MSTEIISADMAMLAKRRAKKMTKAQRAEHARKMALARWAKRGKK